MKVSKGEKLLVEFSGNAQSWGWAEDRAFGSSFDKSKKIYEYSFKKLLEYIKKLEKDNKNLKGTISSSFNFVYNCRGELIPNKEN